MIIILDDYFLNKIFFHQKNKMIKIYSFLSFIFKVGCDSYNGDGNRED
jgi:hypothetical protein